MDREKVIEGLECCVAYHIDYDLDGCDRCPYNGRKGGEGCDYLSMDAIALLKEQEAVEPVRDEKTGRFWLCGNCGEYVGFEDNDPSDPNEFDNYCRNCGMKVKWDA